MSPIVKPLMMVDDIIYESLSPVENLMTSTSLG